MVQILYCPALLRQLAEAVGVQLLLRQAREVQADQVVVAQVGQAVRV
jgi:hypothetical protein